MHFRLSRDTRIILGEMAHQPLERAAAYLQREVERRTGWSWEIVKGGSAGPADIVLGIPGDGSQKASILPRPCSGRSKCLVWSF